MGEKYDFKSVEEKLLKEWEEKGIYRFKQGRKPVFSVDTPPPTVSGSMHLGHAYSYSHQDFIMRYKRMRGFNVFAPWGFDDNGLATERFVEKKLGIKANKMPRGEFTKKCLEVSREAEGEMIRGWKRIGMSVDWSISYHTISPEVIKKSQLSFIELYKKGRIYRKKMPIMWCPECGTALAQVELKDKEDDSELVYIRFKVDNGSTISIATTRPELMPACVAVFVHPDDSRYKDFVGRKASLPIFNREVPILADDKVDPSFGTGAVYHCTFGDIDDIEWVIKHDLPIIELVNKDGTFNKRAGRYEGMRSREARKEIVKDLEELGVVEKKEPVHHVVNVHERCGTEIEFIMTEQWYIKYLDLKEKLLEQGRKIKWHPAHMRVRYDNWVNGLKWDWCISRQRFFGVPFPVWYCKKCGRPIIADEKELPVDPLVDKPRVKCECGSEEFIAEKDVMDTWATSSLTPMIALKWGQDDDFFKGMFPMDLRPQAHDIITFWAFTTIVKSYLHEKSIPWKNIMISGHALDPRGRKMSKSEGNVINPLSVIDKYGADALRFWVASSKLGEDLPFQEKDLVTGRKMINKLWNASRFVMMNLEDFSHEEYKKFNEEKLEPFDKWFLSTLNRAIKKATESFESYEYSRAKLEVENFFWHIFCDNYLEFVKSRIYNPEKRGVDAKRSAQYTLRRGLLVQLKLLAPIMPFITDEIFHRYYPEEGESIHVSEWPKYLEERYAEEREAGDAALAIVGAIRRYKSSIGKSLGYEIKGIIIHTDNPDMISSVGEDIKDASRAVEIDINKQPPAGFKELASGIEGIKLFIYD